MSERVMRITCIVWGHDWRYHEDPEHTYTGYLERCTLCGAIRQIPQ